jgi:hypothetical protein
LRQATLLKRGLLLEYLTLGWNVVGVILAAVAAHSVALAGFDLDALIELSSATHSPIVLDGKVVCGAKTVAQTAPNLLSFRKYDEQETFLQVRVQGKTNEISVAQAMLSLIVQPGRIFTVDALHTQVHGCHALTVLTVKEDQLTLLQIVQTYFADLHVCFTEAET